MYISQINDKGSPNLSIQGELTLKQILKRSVTYLPNDKQLQESHTILSKVKSGRNLSGF